MATPKPLKYLAALLLSVSGSGSLHAQSSFIDLSVPGVKVVFTQVVVDGFTVTQATATVSETDPNTGEITVRRQTEVVVPDGEGGFNQILTEEETVASPTGEEGVFNVTVTTNETTTELNANQDPTGTTPTTTTTVVVDENVAENDLDLPEVTSFTPIDPELEDPIVISPL